MGTINKSMSSDLVRCTASSHFKIEWPHFVHFLQQNACAMWVDKNGTYNTYSICMYIFSETFSIHFLHLLRLSWTPCRLIDNPLSICCNIFNITGDTD